MNLFVTTRVHVKDGNFLIGAPFDSDRPRHLFFRPTKSVLGRWICFDICRHCLTCFAFPFMFVVWGGLRKSRKKQVFWYSRCVGRALALRAQGQPYGALKNPI